MVQTEVKLTSNIEGNSYFCKETEGRPQQRAGF